MIKKIGILLGVLLIMGSVYATPTHIVGQNSVGIGSAEIAKVEGKIKPVPTGNGNSETVSNGTSTGFVGTYWHWFQMTHHYNKETKKWEKRKYTPTPPRGNYDFKTRTWSK